MRYTRYFNDINKYINLLANDKMFLKRYNEIWDKIKSLSKKEFKKELLQNNKYINAKIKIYKSVMDREFKCKKRLNDNRHCKYIPIAPKENECYAYLSIILLNFIFVNSNNEYYPHIFLKECLYGKNMKELNTSFYDISFDEYVDESDN